MIRKNTYFKSRLAFFEVLSLKMCTNAILDVRKHTVPDVGKFHASSFFRNTTDVNGYAKMNALRKTNTKMNHLELMTNHGALIYERIGCSSRPTCYTILNAKIGVANCLHIEAEVSFAISELFALLNENKANERHKKTIRRRKKRSQFRRQVK